MSYSKKKTQLELNFHWVRLCQHSFSVPVNSRTSIIIKNQSSSEEEKRKCSSMLCCWTGFLWMRKVSQVIFFFYYYYFLFGGGNHLSCLNGILFSHGVGGEQGVELGFSSSPFSILSHSVTHRNSVLLQPGHRAGATGSWMRTSDWPQTFLPDYELSFHQWVATTSHVTRRTFPTRPHPFQRPFTFDKGLNRFDVYLTVTLNVHVSDEYFLSNEEMAKMYRLCIGIITGNVDSRCFLYVSLN